jgi:hypothetical protein
MSSFSVYRQLKPFFNTVHNISEDLSVFIKNVKFILSALPDSIYFRKLLCVKLVRDVYYPIRREPSESDPEFVVATQWNSSFRSLYREQFR